MTAPSKASPIRIFISYRRDDAAYPAGWLFDRLVDHYGSSQVFKDVDSINLGEDFAAEIRAAVGSCAVLLAVIGRQWLTAAGPDGRRRLDDPDDFVRLEIEAALARGTQVIPVLVDGAPVPGVSQLPVTLRSLANRQALELSPKTFGADFGRLLGALESVRELGPAGARLTRATRGQLTAQAPSISWPKTGAIKTTENFLSSLRRAWIRAGAPSFDELARLSAGALSNSAAQNLLEHGRYRTLTQDDIANASLILDALGMPDGAIKRWRRAGRRARRHGYIARWWVVTVVQALLWAAAGCGVGVAVSRLAVRPRLGTGNWWAFGVSSLILIIGFIFIAYFASDNFYWKGYKRAAHLLGWITVICCAAGFLAGWLNAELLNAISHVGHIKLVDHDIHINYIRHIGLNIRNWLIWRF